MSHIRIVQLRCEETTNRLGKGRANASLFEGVWWSSLLELTLPRCLASWRRFWQLVCRSQLFFQANYTQRWPSFLSDKCLSMSPRPLTMCCSGLFFDSSKRGCLERFRWRACPLSFACGGIGVSASSPDSGSSKVLCILPSVERVPGGAWVWSCARAECGR